MADSPFTQPRQFRERCIETTIFSWLELGAKNKKIGVLPYDLTSTTIGVKLYKKE
jgi:hypothetical protein